MGADIWGAGTLVSGLCFAALIVPVFLFRHYVTDKGHFPEAMKEDMQLVGSQRVARRAGILPYVTVAAGIVVIVVTHSLAIY
jgi:hypothetical protein